MAINYTPSLVFIILQCLFTTCQAVSQSKSRILFADWLMQLKL